MKLTIAKLSQFDYRSASKDSSYDRTTQSIWDQLVQVNRRPRVARFL